jgi:hypothetical protein
MSKLVSSKKSVKKCLRVSDNDDYKRQIKLWLKVNGYSRKWLADKLGCNVGTVSNYLSSAVRPVPSLHREIIDRLMQNDQPPGIGATVSTGEACALVPLKLSTDQFYQLESASRQSAMTLSSYVLACALWCSSRGLPPSSVLRDQLSDQPPS